jgi:hypothetical protein
VISIKCKEEIFDVEVIRCRPNKAIGVIDTNISIDFLIPKDLKSITSSTTFNAPYNDVEVVKELKAKNSKVESYDPRTGILAYVVL